jgi:hypothetical protein
MDLMQVHRRQAGIVDWLRANSLLNRTPLVVYTAAVDQADLPRLASGETVLFLAERSTSAEVQSRIVDLLSRIGTNDPRPGAASGCVKAAARRRERLTSELGDAQAAPGAASGCVRAG